MNFSSAPVVTVADQFGNPTTNGLPASLLVNVAAKSGTGTGSLTGSTSYDAGTASGTPGVATFSGLGYASAVSGNSAVQLTATAGGYGAPPSGMAIWLDGSVASSVMTDGTGVVTNWLDLSGQGNNFS